MKGSVEHGSITDRGQALDMGTLSNHLFSLSIDLMCVAGLDGYFKQVNPAFEKTLGWTTAELTARPFVDFIHPEDRAATIAEMQTLSTGALTISFENRYRGKDGSYKWLMWNTTPAPEEGLLYAVAHDITRRKQIEEESLQLAAIIASSRDAIIGKTLEGTIVSWNHGAEKLYGYSAPEVIGRSSLILAPSHDCDDAVIIEKITQGKIVDHYETVRVRKDGRQVAVSLTMSPIRDAGGKITGVSTIARDITQRKLVEEALHESEKRFELAARATSDVIWDWDVTTDNLWLNDSVEALFGYRPDQVQHRRDWWSNLLHPEDRESVRSSLQATLDSGGEFWSGEYRVRRADDTYAYVLDRGFIVHDAGGQPVRMIGSMMDVSEHRRLEQTLAASAAKLERSNRDLEEFASIAS
ncbi:MAG TPA: PAS domain S-box protein, partial [Chloroflexia bacterium]|nr:PAS domain S-box protein [Chloroflexia bacterium]